MAAYGNEGLGEEALFTFLTRQVNHNFRQGTAVGGHLALSFSPPDRQTSIGAGGHRRRLQRFFAVGAERRPFGFFQMGIYDNVKGR